MGSQSLGEEGNDGSLEYRRSVDESRFLFDMSMSSSAADKVEENRARKASFTSVAFLREM